MQLGQFSLFIVLHLKDLFHLQSNEELKSDSEMESSDVGSDNGEDINAIDSEKLDASHREILEKLKRQEQEEREEIERELHEAQMEALERARQHEELRAQELRVQEMRAQDLRTNTSADSSNKTSDNGSAVTQTEIRTQRPPGLLAQHGLTTKTHHHHHSSHNGSGAGGTGPPGLQNGPDANLPKRRSESPRDIALRPVPPPLDRADSRPSPPLPMMPTDMFAHHYPPLHPAFGPGERFLATTRPGSPPTATTPTGSSESHSESIGNAGSPTGHHNWTFEEQFKQVSQKKQLSASLFLLDMETPAYLPCCRMISELFTFSLFHIDLPGQLYQKLSITMFCLYKFIMALILELILLLCWQCGFCQLYRVMQISSIFHCTAKTED